MNNTIAHKKASSFLSRAGLFTIALLIMLIPSVASAYTFNSLLKFGSRGSEVSELQSFLGVGSDGVFGSITKGAVMRYQTAHGLSADGIVGPMTRAALNGGGQQTNNGNAPTISGAYVTASRNSASVIWNTNTPARGMVYYSTSPLTTYERENSVDVSGLTAITDSQDTRTSQNVSLSNLQANTTYYYLIYTTGQNGNVTVTWPATFKTTN